MSLGCSGIAAFFTVWILVPAPLYALWLAGVAGTEGSLWWGLLGFVGTSIGLWALRVGARTAGAVSAALGVFAATVSLLPLAQSLPVAARNGVRLSFTRFFLGERDTAPTTAPETVAFRTIGSQQLLLDVYRAEGVASTEPGPAVIVVHGGSWSAGNKSDFPHWDRWLSRHGYTVFDTQYRLAPQPIWREATGDVQAAVAWVKLHAGRYNVDTNRLALLGRSAGGHLALLAAYTSPDSVRTVVSLYGPTDLAWGYAHPAKPDVINGPRTLRRFLGGDPTQIPDTYAEASPISHVGLNTPPTLLFHGERDLLVGPQHARRLTAKLTDAHVPFQAVYIPYALHGFDYNINGWGAQIEQPVLLAFLHKHLAPAP